jgi:hypothetical protein
MSREELQAYLQAQLGEIRRYQREQTATGRPELDMRRAIDEWSERFADGFRRDWLRDRKPAAEGLS